MVYHDHTQQILLTSLLIKLLLWLFNASLSKRDQRFDPVSHKGWPISDGTPNPAWIFNR